MTYSLAEQFSNVLDLRSLRSAASLGREQGGGLVTEEEKYYWIFSDSCNSIRCQSLDTELRSFTDPSFWVRMMYNLFAWLTYTSFTIQRIKLVDISVTFIWVSWSRSQFDSVVETFPLINKTSHMCQAGFTDQRCLARRQDFKIVKSQIMNDLFSFCHLIF